MASSKLGTKRHCQSCGGKFYDLNKTPIVCPSCGAEFDPEVLLKSRRVKPVAAAPSVAEKPEEDKSVKDEAIETDIDVEEDNIDDDDAVLDDDNDLVIHNGEKDEEDLTSEEMPMEDNLDDVDTIEEED